MYIYTYRRLKGVCCFTYIFDLFFVRFFDVLQDGCFSDLGAKLEPTQELLRSVFTTFWNQAEPVKIVLSYGLCPGSEVWRLSQNRRIFPKFFRVCL